MVADSLEGLPVRVFLKEVKEEVEPEEDRDDDVDVVEGGCHHLVKANDEHHGDAGPGGEYEHDGVEAILPLCVHRNDEVFRLEQVSERERVGLAGLLHRADVVFDVAIIVCLHSVPDVLFEEFHALVTLFQHSNQILLSVE